jgi:hypothetical protein
MKMGRCMLSPEHLDNDSEKLADGRHKKFRRAW